jgi:hypothetical protein
MTSIPQVPQVSRLLNVETSSSESSAVVVRLRMKTKTKVNIMRKFAYVPPSYTCKVIPLRDEDDIPVIINIIHDTHGAKAPYLFADQVPETP